MEPLFHTPIVKGFYNSIDIYHRLSACGQTTYKNISRNTEGERAGGYSIM